MSFPITATATAATVSSGANDSIDGYQQLPVSLGDLNKARNEGVGITPMEGSLSGLKQKFKDSGLTQEIQDLLKSMLAENTEDGRTKNCNKRQAFLNMNGPKLMAALSTWMKKEVTEEKEENLGILCTKGIIQDHERLTLIDISDRLKRTNKLLSFLQSGSSERFQAFCSIILDK